MRYEAPVVEVVGAASNLIQGQPLGIPTDGHPTVPNARTMSAILEDE